MCCFTKWIDRYLLVGRAEVRDLERDRLHALGHVHGDREAAVGAERAADDASLAVVFRLRAQPVDDDPFSTALIMSGFSSAAVALAT